MESIELEDIKNQVKQVLGELLEMARLKPGQILMVGCSSSEIDSFKIGSHSNGDIGIAVFSALNEELKPPEVFLATQYCERLNRALILKEKTAKHYGYETVDVVPQLKAGGSFATAAYVVLKHPVTVRHIRAHAGIDIGDTLIGMHLGGVAVPMRIQIKEISSARIMCTRTKPKFIGGVRAHYGKEHM